MSALPIFCIFEVAVHPRYYVDQKCNTEVNNYKNANTLKYQKVCTRTIQREQKDW